MATDFKLGSAYVDIYPKDTKLKPGLDKAKTTVGNSVDSMQKKINSISFTKIAVGLASAFAVHKLISFTREIQNLASVQITAETKLQSVYRATAGAVGLTVKELENYASKLQDLTGVGDEVTLSNMSLLLTFRNVKTEVFKEGMALALDMSKIMKQDLNSSLLQLGKALNDPILGVTALRRVGIQFTESEQAKIKALTESGRIMEAQKIILNELRHEFGGAAEDFRNTMPGAIAATTARIDDLKEELGRLVFDNKSFPAVMNVIGDFVKSWTGSLTNLRKSGRFDDLFVDIAINIINTVKKLVSAFGWLYKSWQGLKNIAGAAGLALWAGRESDAAKAYVEALEDVRQSSGAAKVAAQEHAEKLNQQWQEAVAVRQAFHDMWAGSVDGIDNVNAGLRTVVSGLEDIKVKINEVDLRDINKSGNSGGGVSGSGNEKAVADYSEMNKKMLDLYVKRREDEIALELKYTDKMKSIYNKSTDKNKEIWNNAFQEMGRSVEDLVTSFIEGTASMTDVMKAFAADITGTLGSAIGQVFGGNIGGKIGGAIGRVIGSFITGGKKTVYEETGGATVGRTDSGGIGLISKFSASNETGGALANELNSYVSNALSDVNRSIEEALEKATPEQAAELNSVLDTITADLGAKYKSGFFGYSISEKTKDRSKDLEEITDNIQSYLDRAIGGVEDLANGIVESAADIEEAAKDAADAAKEAEKKSKEIIDSVSKAISNYNAAISDINSRTEAALSPWQSLSSSIQNTLTTRERSGWGIEDYVDKLDELISSGDDSVEVLNEQVELLDTIASLTEEELSQTKALISAIDGVLHSFYGGSMAAVQSGAYYGLEYQSLLSSALSGNVDAAEAFQNFVGEYADFMKVSGQDYNLVVKEIIADLESIKSVFEGREQELATNEMLLATTRSTNDLLTAILHKADQQIAAIKQQADAERSAAAASLNAQNEAAISSYIANMDWAAKNHLAALKYLQDNQDILSAYPNTAAGASQHYIEWGKGEGRVWDMSSDNPYIRDYAKQQLGLGASGGLMTSPTIGGEAGGEWFVPTYEPERSSFLKNVGADPEKIGKAIVKNLMAYDSARGGSSGGLKAQIKVKQRVLGDIIADEIDGKNPRLLSALARMK